MWPPEDSSERRYCIATTGPHEFRRASNSAKNADTHLVIPTGVVQNLPTLLEAQNGQILPFDSTSLGGDDAFTLWTQR
jgi:hypothetical protein